MKQIIISLEKDGLLMVCIMDPVRKGDKNVFYCSFESILDIIKSNINLKY